MRAMVMQDIGGTRRTIEAGIAMVRDMLPAANAIRREKVSASHIKVGLECGGSDGFSGITANPALGAAMDILVRHGGTTPLHAVYEYAEPIDRAGFVFMDSPGYDPVACTGQIASGANLICFTTGRGSM